MSESSNASLGLTCTQRSANRCGAAVMCLFLGDSDAVREGCPCARFAGVSLGGEGTIRIKLRILLCKTVMVHEVILLVETTQDCFGPFGRIARHAHQMGLEDFKIVMS